MSKHRRSPVAGIEPLEDRKLLAASIKIVGNGQRIVPGDTSASRDDFTDYGPMALAGPITAAGRTYTIKNQGDAPLQMTGARISIQGADANQFSVSKSVKASIAAGGGATFRIKFDPTSAGVKRATIVVTSISQKATYKFSIAARGVQTTAVTGGTHVAVIKAGSGEAAVNDRGLKMNYTGFFSYGDVFDSSLDEANDVPFEFGLGGGGVIQGWDNGLLGTKVGDKLVLFVPAAQGYGSSPRDGIPVNSDLIFETETLALTKPSLKVTGNGVKITDGDTTPSTSDNTAFGSVARNSTIVKTFTVSVGETNGSAIPRFTDQTKNIHVAGSNASEFVASGITRNANGTVSFTVTFKPTSTGTRNARIEIPNNNPLDDLYTFSISGVGT